MNYNNELKEKIVLISSTGKLMKGKEMIPYSNIFVEWAE